VVTPLNSRRRQPLAGQQLADGVEKREAESSPAATVSEAVLKDLRESIDQLPEVNATKVVQLHQRIMASEYVVDVDRLTNKLLALEASLLQE